MIIHFPSYIIRKNKWQYAKIYLSFDKSLYREYNSIYLKIISNVKYILSYYHKLLFSNLDYFRLLIASISPLLFGLRPFLAKARVPASCCRRDTIFPLEFFIRSPLVSPPLVLWAVPDHTDAFVPIGIYLLSRFYFLFFKFTTFVVNENNYFRN